MQLDYWASSAGQNVDLYAKYERTTTTYSSLLSPTFINILFNCQAKPRQANLEISDWENIHATDVPPSFSLQPAIVNSEEMVTDWSETYTYSLVQWMLLVRMWPKPRYRGLYNEYK